MGKPILRRLLIPVLTIALTGMATITAAFYWDSPAADVDQTLPVVGSYEKLKELLDKAANRNQMSMLAGGFATADTAVSAPRAAQESAKAENKSAAPAAGTPGSKSDSDYSRTNTQVEGVDEADVVKTDGQYLYQISKQNVNLIKAYPAAEMTIASTIKYTDKYFSARELFVDGDRLVVIGSSQYRWENDDPVIMTEPRTSAAKPAREMAPSIYPPPYRMQETTLAFIYDISDKKSPKYLRQIELEGSYLSSRKIGSSVYLVANQHISTWHLKENADFPTPFYRDSAIGEEKIHLSYDVIRYFPEVVQPNYLLVAGFQLEQPDNTAQVSAYLGSGQNIFVSPEHLYVVTTQYNDQVVIMNSILPNPMPNSPDNLVYKFKLNNGIISYLTKQEVPGMVLNQFSMDEYQGYFRIATTIGFLWGQGADSSKNNLYIYDEKLQLTGKVENIAPGEKIYSVRFMGEKAYMVTFRTVDPLFVISLKDPANPVVLGALKIPGYSDYLHPYDENHLIGFGKDTVEVKKDTTTAYYQGLKMALFDVTDPTNPKEMFVEKIGDRGTESDLLHNHKALLFSKEKSLLSFPVTLMEIKGQSKSPTDYGTFSFQGAYVYNLDLEKGFALKGRISHLTEEDYLKAGHYWPPSEKNVERILYIDNSLYTIGQSKVKAHQLPDLEYQGEVLLK